MMCQDILSINTHLHVSGANTDKILVAASVSEISHSFAHIVASKDKNAKIQGGNDNLMFEGRNEAKHY